MFKQTTTVNHFIKTQNKIVSLDGILSVENLGLCREIQITYHHGGKVLLEFDNKEDQDAAWEDIQAVLGFDII